MICQPALVRAALSVCLAAWLALSPLLHVAHLVFADHDHHYCFAHGRIEDVPRDTAAGRAVDATTDAATRHATVGNQPRAAADAHVVCAVLNHTFARDPLLPPDLLPALVHPEPPLSARAGQQNLAPPCPLLHRAPKTSPPLRLS